MCWFAALAILASGCSRDQPRPLHREVSDSSGVRIVSYDLTDATVPTYRTIGDPDVEIGVREGEPAYAFSRIVDIVAGGDGSLIVSDALARALRVYDQDGVHLRTIGRPGEGPGEFAVAPTVAGVADDTLVAFDRRSNRLTTFSGAGEVLDITTLGPQRPVIMVRQDDGTYLSQTAWVPPVPDLSVHDFRLELDSVVITHVDADGALIDTVLVIADRAQVRLTQDAGGRMRTIQAEPPFRPRAFLGSDGSRPIVARSDALLLELRASDGTPEAEVRVQGARNPMTPEEIRAGQEEAVIEALGEQADPRTRQLNLDYLPDRLPAFHTMIVGRNGEIWVARAEFDESAGYEWLVFDPAGDLLGSIRTPPGMTLFEVETDFVVGVVVDEFDVPIVRRYPLVHVVPEDEQ